MKKITIRVANKNKNVWRIYCGITKVGYVHLFPNVLSTGLRGKSRSMYDVSLRVSGRYYVKTTYKFGNVQKIAEKLMRYAIEDMANELSKFESIDNL